MYQVEIKELFKGDRFSTKELKHRFWLLAYISEKPMNNTENLKVILNYTTGKPPSHINDFVLYVPNNTHVKFG